MFHEHFGIPPEAVQNIPPKEQLRAMPHFSNGGNGSTERPFSLINLMFYLDNCGPKFMDVQTCAHEKIAKAMFNSLSNKDKVQVYQYAEFLEEEDA
jgi:hypothetical protein